MTPSTKAILYSTLVFPGTGQLVLKRYYRGMVLSLTSLASLVVLTRNIYQTASAVADKLLNSGEAVDITSVTEAVRHASDTTQRGVSSMATFLLLACWLYGIIDACRAPAENTPS